jgi:hypothetical protein
MNINKKIGMNEILSELNLNDTGERWHLSF